MRGRSAWRRLLTSKHRSATAMDTCTGSTARPARRGERPSRRSRSSPTPSSRFAKPPSSGRTGRTRFSDSLERSSTGSRTSIAAPMRSRRRSVSDTRPGDRETTQLADGYRARAEALARTARTLAGLAQEQEYLTRAAEAYRRSLDLYAKVVGFADVARTMRLDAARARSDRAAHRRALPTGCPTLATAVIPPRVVTTHGRPEPRLRRDGDDRHLHVRRRSRHPCEHDQRARQFGAADFLMWATSCVAFFAISLAYTGRLHVFEAIRGAARRRPHRQLEYGVGRRGSSSRPWRPIFANAADRQFAARELLRFVETDRNAGRAQPNVGAITRATVRLDAIEREPRLEVLARRAQTARETARTSGDSRPRTMPLFTASDLAAVKPFLVRAHARRVPQSAAVARRALPSGISVDRAGLAAAGNPRRSSAVGGGSPAHRRRLRGLVEPRRSAARQPAVCPVRGRRAGRSAADHGVVARSISGPPRFWSSAIFRSSPPCRCRCC